MQDTKFGDKSRKERAEHQVSDSVFNVTGAYYVQDILAKQNHSP